MSTGEKDLSSYQLQVTSWRIQRTGDDDGDDTNMGPKDASFGSARFPTPKHTPNTHQQS